MLEPDGEDRFLNFPRDRSLLGQKEIFGELLGEGRAALHRAAAREIVKDGAQNTGRINAKMRIKMAVLDRDKGLGQIGGQIGQAHRGAAGVAAIGEQSARLVENCDVRRPFRHGKGVDGRQFRGLIGDNASPRHGGPDSGDQAPIQHKPGQRAAFPASGSRGSGLTGQLSP